MELTLTMTNYMVKIAGLIHPADINILFKGSDGFYHLDAMMLGIGGIGGTVFPS
jgi:hypothetical protein